MEYEIRYYFNNKTILPIINILDNNKGLNKNLKTYEKTIQYNHSDPKNDFYSKKVDGRFRVRISKNKKNTKCKLSWKKRLSDTIGTNFNKEEEIELNIQDNEYDNLIYLIENVMCFSIVESYERYRTVYENDNIEISIDEYPFGIALEIESKKGDPKSNIHYWLNILNLNIDNAYRLSWDDKYEELCKEQNIKIYKEVTFNKDMPNII